MKEYIAARDEDGELIIEQEITRCKDCKHYHQGFGCDLMQRPSVGKDLDWFCADGERKEGQ